VALFHNSGVQLVGFSRVIIPAISMTEEQVGAGPCILCLMRFLTMISDSIVC
jgi:hypothetical protein